MHFGGRAAQIVELLDGCAENIANVADAARVAFARSCDRVVSSKPYALDNAPASRLEDLTRHARRTQLQSEYVPVPELRSGHFLLAIMQRLDGPDRVPQVRRFL